MRYILTLCIFVTCLFAHSQKQALIFLNNKETKAVQISRGGMVVLQYQGYLKQLEQETNYIIDVNDSTITLGKPRVFSSPKDVKEIRIKDIRGFRRISVGSQLLKMVLTVGATLGTYYAITENGDDLTNTQELLFSTGAGLAARISLNIIFPDNKIKHKVKDKWKVITR